MSLGNLLAGVLLGLVCGVQTLENTPIAIIISHRTLDVSFLHSSLCPFLPPSLNYVDYIEQAGLTEIPASASWLKVCARFDQ